MAISDMFKVNRPEVAENFLSGAVAFQHFNLQAPEIGLLIGIVIYAAGEQMLGVYVFWKYL